MKKSALVAVGLASTVAALLAGCSTQSQTADCVDSTGRVLPDSYCQGGGTYYYSSNHYYYHPHWIYGGHISTFHGYSRVTGGSFSPMSGASVSSRSGASISHGGFGMSGFGHGFGGRGG
jgi:hypothetical protein